MNENQEFLKSVVAKEAPHLTRWVQMMLTDPANRPAFEAALMLNGWRKHDAAGEMP